MAAQSPVNHLLDSSDMTGANGHYNSYSDGTIPSPHQLGSSTEVTTSSNSSLSPSNVNSPHSVNAHASISPFLPLVHLSWPPGLPAADLLRHLVDVFFVFHPHSHRLLHFPTFMGSLALPPNHPKFPAAPVLHAICAMGSLYTAAVTSPPLPNFAEIEPGRPFKSIYGLHSLD